MTSLRIGLVLALAAGMLGHCSRKAPPAPLPVVPVKAGPEINVRTEALPLDAANPAKVAVDGFTYAGGLVLSGADTAMLHGLSDLGIAPDGTLMAITDSGYQFEARLQLDAAGRLVGLTDTKLSPLKGLDGKDLQGKDAADSEGQAIFANGDRLVSFERDHRIWLYPAGGGAPRAVNKPATTFPFNEGMEAIAAYPAAGPDAYLASGEEGEVWLCRLSAPCQGVTPQQGPDFTWGLTGMAAFNGKAIATLHRGYDPLRGFRAIVRFVADPLAPANKQVHNASLHLDGSLSRDNFEGIALSSSPSGATRIYLISDDQAVGNQRTLLMAFDWTPPPPPPPAPPKPPRKPVRRE